MGHLLIRKSARHRCRKRSSLIPIAGAVSQDELKRGGGELEHLHEHKMKGRYDLQNLDSFGGRRRLQFPALLHVPSRMRRSRQTACLKGGRLCAESANTSKTRGTTLDTTSRKAYLHWQPFWVACFRHLQARGFRPAVREEEKILDHGLEDSSLKILWTSL